VHGFVSLDGIHGTLNGPKLLTGNNALLNEAVILLDDVPHEAVILLDDVPRCRAVCG
jgi:hypothetical protein